MSPTLRFSRRTRSATPKRLRTSQTWPATTPSSARIRPACTRVPSSAGTVASRGNGIVEGQPRLAGSRHDPYTKWLTSSRPMKLSNSVEIVSFTPTCARSRPATPPHIAPPSMADTSTAGRSHQPASAAPASITAVPNRAPMYSWPSAPTESSPRRAGTMMARAQSRMGVAFTSVSETEYQSPNAKRSIALSMGRGGRPMSTKNAAATATKATTASATDGAVRVTRPVRSSRPSAARAPGGSPLRAPAPQRSGPRASRRCGGRSAAARRDPPRTTRHCRHGRHR